MIQFPFPVVPELMAVANTYRNTRLIADMVSLRKTVGLKTFRYPVFSSLERFTAPDDFVGRKSVPNEVDFSSSETEASTVDHALDDPVPQDDVLNAPPGVDPLGEATEGLTDLILLNREIRLATQVMSAASYASGHSVTLSTAADKWSTPTTSHPIADITTGLDTGLVRQNVMVIGRKGWNALAQHADIVKAINRTGGDSGIATRQEVAALFELDEVLVGDGWYNTAKKGQPGSRVRIWGPDCALIVRNPQANLRGGAPTFCLTAQFGQRIAGAEQDSKIGMRGGQRVRVGESVAELVICDELGYLIKAVAE